MFEDHYPFLSTLELSMRFLVAACLGAVIGLDRELRNRPAGLRTHMITSLAACVFTVLAMELQQSFPGSEETLSTDPVRIIEAVTAGVAFLAAGAIIQGRGTVHGLTTGAAMWLAGAIGVACGSGRYDLALIAVALAVCILVMLRPIERKFVEIARKNTGEDGGE